jgi:predicted DNA-binding transcriptional regulator
MSIADYISNQHPARQELLKKIHEIIIREDKTVTAAVEPMMGKEMIIYKAMGSFKYGLSSVKKHISLHLMPIYSSIALYTKYKGLLNKATFQKGCINFRNEEEMPLEIVKQLMNDCSKIDLRAIREAAAK